MKAPFDRPAMPWTMSLLTLLVATCVGCAPEDPDPTSPTLTWISINATAFQSASENVTVTLGYQDHQGDLGWADPDRHALEVQDQRLDAPDTYHIPPLTPEGMALDISGTFEVTIPPLFLLGTGGDEETRLTFRITDRAGHASNTVQSPVILITDTL
ncbi:MAG: hypothetical protein L7S67_10110 [Flavobacteriales bacterium]|nr:hypothetical protein [Flavobacteriales bacterium]